MVRNQNVLTTKSFSIPVTSCVSENSLFFFVITDHGFTRVSLSVAGAGLKYYSEFC